MAQRRMLSKRISQSKKVNALSLKAQIVWTWTIPWLDDYGCYEADPEDIKTEVFPKNMDITEQVINNALSEEQKIGLIKIFTANGKVYQKYNNFEDFQTLKTDRPKKSDIKGYYKGMELDGIQRNPEESSGSPEVKLREAKLSKDIQTPFVFPLRNGVYALGKEKISEYQNTYQNIDIMQTLKECIQWNRDNEARRKTSRGILKHINAWLKGANEDKSYVAKAPEMPEHERDTRTPEQKKADMAKFKAFAGATVKKLKRVT